VTHNYHKFVSLNGRNFVNLSLCHCNVHALTVSGGRQLSSMNAQRNQDCTRWFSVNGGYSDNGATSSLSGSHFIRLWGQIGVLLTSSKARIRQFKRSSPKSYPNCFCQSPSQRFLSSRKPVQTANLLS
jgi:hypothetical protein